MGTACTCAGIFGSKPYASASLQQIDEKKRTMTIEFSVKKLNIFQRIFRALGLFYGSTTKNGISSLLITGLQHRHTISYKTAEGSREIYNNEKFAKVICYKIYSRVITRGRDIVIGDFEKEMVNLKNYVFPRAYPQCPI